MNTMTGGASLSSCGCSTYENYETKEVVKHYCSEHQPAEPEVTQEPISQELALAESYYAAARDLEYSAQEYTRVANMLNRRADTICERKIAEGDRLERVEQFNADRRLASLEEFNAAVDKIADDERDAFIAANPDAVIAANPDAELVTDTKRLECLARRGYHRLQVFHSVEALRAYVDRLMKAER